METDSTQVPDSPVEGGKGLCTVLIAESAGELIAIPIVDVRGVGNIGKVTQIPGAKSAIRGLAYFRGGIEAVIDLAAIWQGEQSVIDNECQAVLIESEGMRALLIVRSLHDLFDLETPLSKVSSTLDLRKPGLVNRINWRQKTVGYISVSRLLRYLSSSTQT